MIKAFLFDYDGVMTNGVKDGVPAARLSRKLGISQDQASQYIANVWSDYSTGKLSDGEAWEQIEKDFGKPIAPQYRDIWYKWEELTPLPQMVELVKELKSKGFAVGLLSNVLPITAKLIREKGGYDHFDFVILSNEAGARKPDENIYRAALARLEDTQPEEVIFFDDRQLCVDGAELVGINAMLLTDHAKAIEEVHRIISAR